MQWIIITCDDHVPTICIVICDVWSDLHQAHLPSIYVTSSARGIADLVVNQRVICIRLPYDMLIDVSRIINT